MSIGLLTSMGTLLFLQGTGNFTLLKSTNDFIPGLNLSNKPCGIIFIKGMNHANCKTSAPKS